MRTICTVAFLAFAVSSPTWTDEPPPSPRDRSSHVEWVAQALRNMQSVKPGMTRAQLLETFATEGGFVHDGSLRRTYVYRDCPYFKVDVEFEALGNTVTNPDGRVTSAEADGDVIKHISKPYLEWGISD